MRAWAAHSSSYDCAACFKYPGCAARVAHQRHQSRTVAILLVQAELCLRTEISVQMAHAVRARSTSAMSRLRLLSAGLFLILMPRPGFIKQSAVM